MMKNATKEDAEKEDMSGDHKQHMDTPPPKSQFEVVSSGENLIAKAWVDRTKSVKVHTEPKPKEEGGPIFKSYSKYGDKAKIKARVDAEDMEKKMMEEKELEP